MAEIIERMMTKDEAEKLDSQIMTRTDDWFHNVAPLVMQMRDKQGYIALGYKTFGDYCSNVDERLGYQKAVKRLVDRATVESNIGLALPARHAYVLAELPTPEAQKEVFEAVMSEYQTPIERNYQVYVDQWLKKHSRSTRKTKDDSDGWSKADLEADTEIADALDRIESVWGTEDRKAIQDGTIGLSRKDIIALSGFHVSRMKAVHYLIMANHWDLARALKFINETPNGETTVHELQNHALATPGFYYTCQVEGYDIQIKACKALTGKLKD